MLFTSGALSSGDAAVSSTSWTRYVAVTPACEVWNSTTRSQPAAQQISRHWTRSFGNCQFSWSWSHRPAIVSWRYVSRLVPILNRAISVCYCQDSQIKALHVNNGKYWTFTVGQLWPVGLAFEWFCMFFFLSYVFVYFLLVIKNVFFSSSVVNCLESLVSENEMICYV